MDIKLLNKSISDIDADITVVFVDAEDLQNHPLKDTLHMAGFEAKQESVCFLHEKELVFCGVQNKESDDLRASVASGIKALKSTNYNSIKISVLNKNLLSAFVDGIVLGGYEFDKYKSKPKAHFPKSIFLCWDGENFQELEKDFEDALIISNATNFTRDIVNQAPQELNPQTFAELAKKLSQENSLECKILNETELRNENMNAMLAVGRASIHESRLIHLAYKPKNPKKTVTLVGKGLTYDSGGLSLKPSTSMVTMKMDKAGACATLGIIKAVSELKLDIELHVFIGAVENMIGGNAYKPDDVLVSKSGTTIEVRNTDAEGRLVLADVLTYAQESVDADRIFDFATLTGACMVALGQYTTGVMGHSSRLKHELSKSVKSSGELIGTLPFNKHLKKLLKSDIADISNVSSKPYGGAITAGLFLDEFIKDENKEKWLHFDIAGSAYTESAWDVNSYGATGAGVRMMSRYLKDL